MYHSFKALSKTVWNEWKTTMLRLAPDIQKGLLLQFHLTAEWWQEKQWHTTEQPARIQARTNTADEYPAGPWAHKITGSLSCACMHARLSLRNKTFTLKTDAMECQWHCKFCFLGNFSKRDWPTLNWRDICNCSSTLWIITSLRTILQHYHSAIPNKLPSRLFSSSCRRREGLPASSGVTQRCAFLGVQ